MNPTKIIRYALLSCVIVLGGTICATAQKTDCTSKSDNDLVVDVYKAIQKKYPDAVKNINVTVKNGVVKLEGWAATAKIVKSIAKIVNKVKCVKSVDNKLEPGKTGGCGPGQKECGGACISEKDVCNVCLTDPGAPGCATGGGDPKKP